jgi:hypothetical protein
MSPRPQAAFSFCIGFLLIALWGQNGAWAGPADCIKAVAGAKRLASGIATAVLEDTLFIERCEGGWFRLTVPDGEFLLTETNMAQPARSADMLPDGEVTGGDGWVSKAWLSGPAGRYGHGILGDAIEASAIHVVMRDGSSHDLPLMGKAVFEDLRVRLVDLNGDNKEELIVIRSDAQSGAALAAYRVSNTGIEQLAAGPPIGQPYRWLNPAGAADFDGDGAIEIAYVETPHIGGILRVYELDGAELILEQSVAGFSNHAIGSRVLDMSAVIDWNGDGIPDLALPDDSRRRMKIISLAHGEFELLATIPHPASISTAIMASDLDGDGAPELIYGLSDGSLIVTRP